MGRSQQKRRAPQLADVREPQAWTMKDGLIVPAEPGDTVIDEHMAASAKGQEALANILEAHKDKLPTEAMSAHYDGVAREAHKSEVVLELRTMPVAWGFPFDELTYTKWVINLLGLRMMPWDDYLTASSTYLPDARNIIHRQFVEDSKCPYLMMLDSDVLCPPDIIKRLLAHDKPMVGGFYRMKGEPYSPVVYDKTDKIADNGYPLYAQRTEPGEGLEAVDGAGAGVWLMSREVAEALGPKPYDMSSGGEDLLLCMKVQDLGYETWIDWDIACAHAGVAIV